MSTPSLPARRMDHIDGLRGIAAMLVLMQHTLEQSPVLLSLTPGNPLGNFLLDNLNLGRLGVIIFFLISGFLIPSTLKPDAGSSRLVLARFAISRLARLYPLYWVSLITGALVAAALALPMLSAIEFLAALTMMQKLFGVRDLYGPYWTLFVEIIFYAACIALFLAGQLYRPGRMLALVLLGILGSCLLSLITVYTGHLGGVHSALLQGGGFLNYLLVMFTGYLFRLHWDGRLTTRALVAAASGIVLAYAVYAVCRTVNLNYSELLTPRAIFCSSTLGLFIFALTLRYRLWQSPLLVYLGAISYGLYLFHAQVIHIAVWLNGGPATSTTQTLILLTFVLLLTTLIAHATYKLVETPGIALGQYLRKRL